MQMWLGACFTLKDDSWSRIKTDACRAVVTRLNKDRHHYKLFSGWAVPQHPLGRTIWYFILYQKAKPDSIQICFWASRISVPQWGSGVWGRWKLSGLQMKKTTNSAYTPFTMIWAHSLWQNIVVLHGVRILTLR